MVEEFLHASSDIKLPERRRGHPLSGPGFFQSFFSHISRMVTALCVGETFIEVFDKVLALRLNNTWH